MDCDLQTSPFQVDEDNKEDVVSPYADLVDNKREGIFMTNNWEWKNWEDVGDEEEVHGLQESNCYNSPHALKSGIAKSFGTTLQCIMRTSAMSIEFFERLTAQINNYARKNMKSRSLNLFIGYKWTNIRIR